MDGATRTYLTRVAILAGALAALATVFYFAPLPFNGVDWLTYHETALRLLQGLPIYGVIVGANCVYFNAPWLIVILAPIALLPFRLGYGLFCALNVGLVYALGRRFGFSPAKIAALLVSPPVVYVLLYGQVDLVVLSLAIFLPVEFRPLVALAKPQTVIALSLGALRRWRTTLVVTILGILLSLALFGNWPVAALSRPLPYVDNPNNYWFGFWPSQLPLAALLMVLGGFSSDLLLMAASPFVSPYATTYSFVGPAMAIVSRLRIRDTVLVWIVWWGVIIFRWLVGGHA